jgi:alanine dehydrogenase
MKAGKMALYITNAEVRELVGIDDALNALEGAFAHWGAEGTANVPRQRMPLPVRSMNLMAASLPAESVFGHKAYFRGCQLFTLFSIEEQRLLAVIEAGVLGGLRTGAATGIAARRLARKDSKTVGLIGAGRQGRTQLMAVCATHPVEMVRVFSRTAETRDAFAAEMAKELGIEVTAAPDAESCVRGADIAIAMTTASEPVILGDWVTPGMFVAGTGANAYARRELDEATVLKADIVATDQRDQAKIEARELMDLTAAGKLAWDDVVELGDIVTDRAPGRTGDDQITVFKSLGLALEDVAFGKVIYERAVAAGIGERFGPQA